MKSEILQFYLEQGPRTRLDPSIVSQFPKKLADIVARIQGILTHAERVHAQKILVAPENSAIRDPKTAAEVFSKINLSNLNVELPLEKRAVGICRNFAMLVTVFLREVQVPARARCGFATYFEQDYFEDHWVSEYWNSNEERWVRVDAQLDSYWLQHVDVDPATFSNLDVPSDQFLSAGEVWQRYRSGSISADRCGFSLTNDSGEYYIRGNLIRDFFALNKFECTYQEDSRFTRKETVLTAADLETLDRVAEISADPDKHFEDMRRLVVAEPGLGPAAVVGYT